MSTKFSNSGRYILVTLVVIIAFILGDLFHPLTSTYSTGGQKGSSPYKYEESYKVGNMLFRLEVAFATHSNYYEDLNQRFLDFLAKDSTISFQLEDLSNEGKRAVFNVKGLSSVACKELMNAEAIYSRRMLMSGGTPFSVSLIASQDSFQFSGNCDEYLILDIALI